MNAARYLTIQIPEGVSFRLELAGPNARFMAWVIDAMAVGAAWSLAMTILGVFKLISIDWALAASSLLGFVLSWGYGIGLEWLWRGQTLGKRVMKLRVVDATGLKLTLGQVVVRNFLRLVDRLPFFYFVGGAAMFFSSRAQRLGDIAANTVVIQEMAIRDVDWKQLQAGKYNSLRPHLRASARLRAATTPAEADLALSALLRREGLEPAERVRLFDALAAHFVAKADFPADVLEGLSGEAIVRNVVEILYRSAEQVLADQRKGTA